MCLTAGLTFNMPGAHRKCHWRVTDRRGAAECLHLGDCDIHPGTSESEEISPSSGGALAWTIPIALISQLCTQLCITEPSTALWLSAQRAEAVMYRVNRLH